MSLSLSLNIYIYIYIYIYAHTTLLILMVRNTTTSSQPLCCRGFGNVLATPLLQFRHIMLYYIRLYSIISYIIIFYSIICHSIMLYNLYYITSIIHYIMLPQTLFSAAPQAARTVARAWARPGVAAEALLLLVL